MVPAMIAPSARAAAWIELAMRPVPLRSLAALLRAFGTPEAILAARPAQLAAQAPPMVVERIVAPVDAGRRAAALAWASIPGHEIIAWDDTDYPQTLLELADAPPALFFVGRRELLKQPALAIVGSRNATHQGLETARAFARALAENGLLIVSGLALGIDGAAHRGALEANGSTLAVVGTGLDRVYPPSHRDLAHRLAERGGLLSEFAPGTPPLRANFPRRNRLISGLARGVLVVEATLSSGSLITARCAVEQGREVFAIPGSIHSPFSKGPHRLIRDGAKLVETAKDVLDELGLPATGATASTPLAPDGPHALLTIAMGHDPASIDLLAVRTGLSAEAIAAGLIELELSGCVASLPGGRWQRLG